uniref:Cytochrome c oxidase subunit 2 n=1 Tax=Endeis sp. JZ-2022 TaxID=2992007 RepID=A0A9E7V7J2_9CHEL|nr:cytochrome c oxidase subunit 2 [Endeis sp. JZ-2022]
MPTWNHLNLQNSATPSMEQLTFFHDHSLMILSAIITFILYTMIMSMLNKNINMNLYESQGMETIWTLTPALILIIITMPSLRILYLMEEINSPFITIKTIGHQWYWTYEYSDFNNIEFDSFMTKSKSMRLLDTDTAMIVPMNTLIRVLTTSQDVIHAWTIPSMGIKMDSIPGRINQSNMIVNRPGIFVGQCSEICGANHSFMPIKMESVNINTFIKWINSM